MTQATPAISEILRHTLYVFLPRKGKLFILNKPRVRFKAAISHEVRDKPLDHCTASCNTVVTLQSSSHSLAEKQ